MAITDEVQTAIDEVRATFPDSSITVEESGDGGAWLTIDPVPTGPSFYPATTWMRFHIPYNYPEADIYPHFITPELRRKTGEQLGDALQQIINCGPQGNIPATQISRRTNTLDPGTNCAAGKALNVLRWLESR